MISRINFSPSSSSSSSAAAAVASPARFEQSPASAFLVRAFREERERAISASPSPKAAQSSRNAAVAGGDSCTPVAEHAPVASVRRWRELPDYASFEDFERDWFCNGIPEDVYEDAETDCANGLNRFRIALYLRMKFGDKNDLLRQLLDALANPDKSRWPPNVSDFENTIRSNMAFVPSHWGLFQRKDTLSLREQQQQQQNLHHDDAASRESQRERKKFDFVVQLRRHVNESLLKIAPTLFILESMSSGACLENNGRLTITWSGVAATSDALPPWGQNVKFGVGPVQLRKAVGGMRVKIPSIPESSLLCVRKEVLEIADTSVNARDTILLLSGVPMNKSHASQHFPDGVWKKVCDAADIVSFDSIGFGKAGRARVLVTFYLQHQSFFGDLDVLYNKLVQLGAWISPGILKSRTESDGRLKPIVDMNNGRRNVADCRVELTDAQKASLEDLWELEQEGGVMKRLFGIVHVGNDIQRLAGRYAPLPIQKDEKLVLFPGPCSAETLYRDYGRSRGALLMNPTGTGKTRIALTYVMSMDQNTQHTTLIVVPSHLVTQWTTEMRKSFGERLPINPVAPVAGPYALVTQDPKQIRKLPAELADAAKLNRPPIMVVVPLNNIVAAQKALAHYSFRRVIVDEAHTANARHLRIIGSIQYESMILVTSTMSKAMTAPSIYPCAGTCPPVWAALILQSRPQGCPGYTSAVWTQALGIRSVGAARVSVRHVDHVMIPRKEVRDGTRHAAECIERHLAAKGTLRGIRVSAALRVLQRVSDDPVVDWSRLVEMLDILLTPKSGSTHKLHERLSFLSGRPTHSCLGPHKSHVLREECECMICFEDGPGVMWRQLNCGHVFCANCLFDLCDMRAKQNGVNAEVLCPACRTRATGVFHVNWKGVEMDVPAVTADDDDDGKVAGRANKKVDPNFFRSEDADSIRASHTPTIWLRAAIEALMSVGESSSSRPNKRKATRASSSSLSSSSSSDASLSSSDATTHSGDEDDNYGDDVDDEYGSGNSSDCTDKYRASKRARLDTDEAMSDAAEPPAARESVSGDTWMSDHAAIIAEVLKSHRKDGSYVVLVPRNNFYKGVCEQLARTHESVFMLPFDSSVKSKQATLRTLETFRSVSFSNKPKFLLMTSIHAAGLNLPCVQEVWSLALADAALEEQIVGRGTRMDQKFSEIVFRRIMTQDSYMHFACERSRNVRLALTDTNALLSFAFQRLSQVPGTKAYTLSSAGYMCYGRKSGGGYSTY